MVQRGRLSRNLARKVAHIDCLPRSRVPVSYDSRNKTGREIYVGIVMSYDMRVG